MLRLPILAEHIANLTDARYFAAREVRWLDFCFDEGHTHSIDVTTAKAMAEWVDGVAPVGSFSLQTPDYIRSVYEAIPLQGLHLNMLTPPEHMVMLRDLPILLEITIDSYAEPEELMRYMFQSAPFVQYYILNFSKSGMTWSQLNNHPPLLDFARRACSQYECIISIDVTARQLPELEKTLQPFGLAFRGGEEEEIGIKSFDELDDLLDLLEV